MSLRFGYAFWGFIADKKIQNGEEVSTPDGNQSYSWSILYEAYKRKWDVWLLQRDRDKEYVNGIGSKAFKAFSQKKRWQAYKHANKTLTTHDIVLSELEDLPDLDVVLIEWRFPIEGRNIGVDMSDPNYQPDLDRQTKLLNYFKSRGTKIILWDLDHKLTIEDELLWKPDAIFETSLKPLHLSQKRVSVEPPIITEDLLQFKTENANENRKLVYVGSRYERDDVITQWLEPISDWYPFEIEFWGNWTREPNLSECREMWPNILYNRRITIEDFHYVYSTAVACPILAKRSYFESGFITPRPWEALMFGTIPVGLSEHFGIEQYVEYVADNPFELEEIVYELSKMKKKDRDAVRKNNIERLYFMDAFYFLNKIEEVVNG